MSSDDHAASGARAQGLDALDRRILRELQQDAGRPLDELARIVGSSRTPVWNRIRRMREVGVIGPTTVRVQPEAVGLDTCFFVLVRTSQHDAEWQARFLQALANRPEVIEAHRLAGQIDYILKLRVKTARDYDHFYQALIADMKIYSMNALLSIEVVKSEGPLPVAD